MAALSGIPLVLENRGRQAEIALFTVYKTMETVYNMGRRRGWPVRIPIGNCIITGLALAIICHHYFNNSEAIKPSYRSVFDHLLNKS